MKNTTFQHKRERTTTHLSGCVVASLFVYAPVVGVKLGGDAAAHPVFCLSSFFLPCHVYALLAHTPLAARRPTTDTTASGGALGTPAHDSPCPRDVVGRCGRIRNVRLFVGIIARSEDRCFMPHKKVVYISSLWPWEFCYTERGWEKWR